MCPHMSSSQKQRRGCSTDMPQPTCQMCYGCLPRELGFAWSRGTRGVSSGDISGHPPFEAKPRKEVARRATGRRQEVQGTSWQLEAKVHSGGFMEITMEHQVLRMRRQMQTMMDDREEARGRERHSEAVCELHGAGCRHGDVEKNDGLCKGRWRLR